MREYLVSEAMAALGVPTTRALAAVWSGDTVYRETPEPGGVFTRVASSHLRIGTAEYFASRQDWGNLRELVSYALDRHYPESKEAANLALALLEGVIDRQARLVARWMGLGFIHGVMNTDNMSLSGETIDYGPCAFMDHFHPARKFSFIDTHGRYAYGNQPAIAHWNLTRLAEALLPLLADGEDDAVALAEAALEQFPGRFQEAHAEVFRAKLGIGVGEPGDEGLVQSLLDLLSAQDVDFTLAFRRLATVLDGDGTAFSSLFSQPEPVADWLRAWKARVEMSGDDPVTIAERMRQTNPAFIPRNHRIEEVILAGKQGDLGPFNRLHQVLGRPFDEQPESVAYEAPPLPHEVVPATYCGT